MPLEKWARNPFYKCIAYIEESESLLALSVEGIYKLSNMVPLAKAVAKLKKELHKHDKPEERMLAATEKLAKMAEDEINKGFPRLYAHAVVDLWSTLEILVNDLLILWLINEPSALKIKAVSKIRISLADYALLEKDEQMLLILNELQRNIKSSLKQGADRFESLLEIFGLSGAINRKVKKDLFELSNIRNVIIHNGAIVDGRLLKACPWIKLKVEDKLNLNYKDYKKYSNAVLKYVTCLLHRVHVTRSSKTMHIVGFKNCPKFKKKKIV